MRKLIDYIKQQKIHESLTARKYLKKNIY